MILKVSISLKHNDHSHPISKTSMECKPGVSAEEAFEVFTNTLTSNVLNLSEKLKDMPKVLNVLILDSLIEKGGMSELVANIYMASVVLDISKIELLMEYETDSTPGFIFNPITITGRC